MRKQFLYIHLCGLFILNCTVIKCNMDAKRLYDDLFSNYNQLVRPVLNDSQSVKVQIKLKLSQLIEVNLKDQIMTTSMWIEHWWHDSNLKWNPIDYGGIEYIHLDSAQIWRPDIVLYNNAAADFEVTLTTKAKLNYKGNIYYSPPAIYKSSCEINVEMFPFDSQNCRMKFGSWTHDGFAIDLNHRDQVQGKAEVESGIDLSDFQASVEWDIQRVPAIKNKKFYLCCESPFLDLTFFISIKRKTLFYTVNLILPCTGISFLTVLVFYLPSDSGEKISLSVSILVALTVFFLLLAETIPPTSLVVPFLGKYLLFTMLLVGLSICVTVIVLNIHFKSTRSVQMSKWMRKIFLEILPKFLLMKRPEYKGINNKYFNQVNYLDEINLVDNNSDKLTKKNKLSVKKEKNFDQRSNAQKKKVKKNENLIKNHLTTIDKKSPFRSLTKNSRIVPLNSSLNNSIYSIEENLDYQSNLNKNINKKRSFYSIQSLNDSDDDDESLKEIDNDYINDCNNNNNNFFINKPLEHSIRLNRQSDIELDNLNSFENLNNKQSINHYQSNKSINQPNILINDCLLCKRNLQIQKHYSDTFVDCKHKNLLSKYRNQLTKSIDQNLLNESIFNQSLTDYKIRNEDQNDSLLTINKQKQKINNEEKIFLEALYKIERNPHIIRAMKNVYFLAEHARKLQQEEEIKDEWHYLAMVLDRLFLWIFLIFVLLGSLSIITIEQNPTTNNNIFEQSNKTNSLNSA